MSKNSTSNQKPTHEEIAACAQAIYEREGRPQGRALQHWLQAEAQLTAQRNKAATAAPQAAKPATAPQQAAKPAAPQAAKPGSAPANKMRGNDWQTTGRPTLNTN